MLTCKAVQFRQKCCSGAQTSGQAISEEKTCSQMWLYFCLEQRPKGTLSLLYFQETNPTLFPSQLLPVFALCCKFYMFHAKFEVQDSTTCCTSLEASILVKMVSRGGSTGVLYSVSSPPQYCIYKKVAACLLTLLCASRTPAGKESLLRSNTKQNSLSTKSIQSNYQLHAQLVGFVLWVGWRGQRVSTAPVWGKLLLHKLCIQALGECNLKRPKQEKNTHCGITVLCMGINFPVIPFKFGFEASISLTLSEIVF